MSAPLRQRLRQETRTAHDRVDAVFERFVLTERASYGAFLAAHYAALTALPLDLAPYGLPPVGLAARLAADLHALGVAPVAGQVQTMRGEDERLGAYYVVAGSRLGAQVLRARWAQASDPAVLGAGRYLSDGTMAEWKALQALLSVGTGIDGDRALDGALAAFGVFGQAGEDRLARCAIGAG